MEKPGDGVGRSGKAGRAGEVAAGEAAPGASFADKLARPAEVAKTGGPTAPGQEHALRAVRVSDVAADLRAGKLTPEAAIDKVLERVMAQQLGPEAPPAVRDRVRVALRDAMENDPLLAAKVAGLR